MRNLKKVLALALVFAMAFTFTASANAVAFTDAAEIDTSYADAVSMLVQLNVLGGYPDGSFQPKGNITRAETAKLVYIVNYGSDTNGDLFAAQTSQFYDVQNNGNVQWAKGYINYCANQKIVSGKGNGKFDPQGNVTVAELAKMLLVSLGCDPAKEGFTGANWMANVTAKAIELGIFNGWAGDPSVPATREVASQLLKNTIFSSVYTYSAITGMGSQMDGLGQNRNKTLGEIKMGLQTVTGIVVANERYALATNEEGKPFGDPDLNFKGGTVKATGEDSGKSMIYYEAQDKDRNFYTSKIIIDRALDDDMLGAKVNVYFKADRVENSSGRIDWKNIEVIGDVVLNAETIIYKVAAPDISAYPNGKSTSSSEIRPYISFMDGDKEVKISTSNDVAKVAKNKDIRDASAYPTENNAVNVDFSKYAYTLNGASFDDNGDFVQDTAFLSGVGEMTLDMYRFVSIDGGNTFSYMFKIADEAQNADYAAVTSYSEKASTIRLHSAGNASGTYDFDDILVAEGYSPAIDDVVVAYRMNGKIALYPVEAITASVDGYTDDDKDGIIISGNACYKWNSCDLEGQTNLFDYFQENRAALRGNAKFYVYNGILMEIDTEGVSITATDAEYAVILRSYYDSDLDTAYVKLGFADNTEGTYAIGKLYTKKASDKNSSLNDIPSDFDLNAYVGMVVNYKLLDDGTVDLSGQYFKDDELLRYYSDGSNVVGYYDDATGEYKLVADSTVTKNSTIGVEEGKLFFERIFDESKLTADEKKKVAGALTRKTYYPVNDNVIVFALYGVPAYKIENGVVSIDPTEDGFLPLKSRAFKLSELKDMAATDIETLYVNVGGNGGLQKYGVGHLLLNSKKATSKYAVAASISVGKSTTGISFKETNALAYVVSAKQRYNAASGAYYAELTLINENGLMNLTTVDDVKDLNNASVLPGDSVGVGPIDDVGGDLPAGSFVAYAIDAEGKVNVLERNDSTGQKREVNTNYVSGVQSGLFLVNITNVRNEEIISFYNTELTTGNQKPVYKDDGVTVDRYVIDINKASLNSIEIHEEDGCQFIGISDGEYTGTGITKVGTKVKEFEPKVGNAVIQVEEGQVVRVFSFADNYVK